MSNVDFAESNEVVVDSHDALLITFLKEVMEGFDEDASKSFYITKYRLIKDESMLHRVDEFCKEFMWDISKNDLLMIYWNEETHAFACTPNVSINGFSDMCQSFIFNDIIDRTGGLLSDALLSRILNKAINDKKKDIPSSFYQRYYITEFLKTRNDLLKEKKSYKKIKNNILSYLTVQAESNATVIIDDVIENGFIFNNDLIVVCNDDAIYSFLRVDPDEDVLDLKEFAYKMILTRTMDYPTLYAYQKDENGATGIDAIGVRFVLSKVLVQKYSDVYSCSEIVANIIKWIAKEDIKEINNVE